MSDMIKLPPHTVPTGVGSHPLGPEIAAMVAVALRGGWDGQELRSLIPCPHDRILCNPTRTVKNEGRFCSLHMADGFREPIVEMRCKMRPNHIKILYCAQEAYGHTEKQKPALSLSECIFCNLKPINQPVLVLPIILPISSVLAPVCTCQRPALPTTPPWTKQTSMSLRQARHTWS